MLYDTTFTLYYNRLYVTKYLLIAVSHIRKCTAVAWDRYGGKLLLRRPIAHYSAD